jgi:hypothetical protein
MPSSFFINLPLSPSLSLSCVHVVELVVCEDIFVRKGGSNGEVGDGVGDNGGDGGDWGGGGGEPPEL